MSNCSANNGSSNFHHFEHKRVIDSRLLAGINLIAAGPSSTRAVQHRGAKICPSFQLILVKTQLSAAKLSPTTCRQHNSNRETFRHSNKSASASENCGISHAFLAAISESAHIHLQRMQTAVCVLTFADWVLSLSGDAAKIH